MFFAPGRAGRAKPKKPRFYTLDKEKASAWVTKKPFAHDVVQVPRRKGQVQDRVGLTPRHRAERSKKEKQWLWVWSWLWSWPNATLLSCFYCCLLQLFLSWRAPPCSGRGRRIHVPVRIPMCRKCEAHLLPSASGAVKEAAILRVFGSFCLCFVRGNPTKNPPV